MTLLDDAGTRGSISTVLIGIPGVAHPKPVPLADLEKELRTWFKAKGENKPSRQKGNAQGNFDQVVINASPTLRWDEVLKVMDMVAKFTTTKGEIPKVSIVATGPEPDGN